MAVPDPSHNASLYQAISKAKSMSVPNDNIEKALKRLSGQQDGDDFEEIFYEGYGPHGSCSSCRVPYRQ